MYKVCIHMQCYVTTWAHILQYRSDARYNEHALRTRLRVQANTFVSQKSKCVKRSECIHGWRQTRTRSQGEANACRDKHICTQAQNACPLYLASEQYCIKLAHLSHIGNFTAVCLKLRDFTQSSAHCFDNYVARLPKKT